MTNSITKIEQVSDHKFNIEIKTASNQSISTIVEFENVEGRASIKLEGMSQEFYDAVMSGDILSKPIMNAVSTVYKVSQTKW